jgi:hypothetical protein
VPKGPKSGRASLKTRKGRASLKTRKGRASLKTRKGRTSFKTRKGLIQGLPLGRKLSQFFGRITLNFPTLGYFNYGPRKLQFCQGKIKNYSLAG